MEMLNRHFNKEYLKHHKSLKPLFVALGFGVGLSFFYTIRLALQNPDVSWRRTSNPEPWQHRVDGDGKTVRYKFFQAPADWRGGHTEYGVAAFPEERPPIEQLWAEYKRDHPEGAGHH